jgi:hypothetical protein
MDQLTVILLIASRVGLLGALVTLGFYLIEESKSGMATAGCLITAVALAAQDGVLLWCSLMSAGVSIRSSLVTAIVLQGAILALTAFATLDPRVRYICLPIAASAPLILLCVRTTE